jgi:hypothetical protein
MSWQRPQKTVKYVMAPYTEGGRYMGHYGQTESGVSGGNFEIL